MARQKSDDQYHSAPLRVDPVAVSAKAGEPAFIAKPPGAPVYYGFQILEDVEFDGFKLGMITDFEAQPDAVGDAFLVAPDDSRCGLMWFISNDGTLTEALAPDESRWGYGPWPSRT